MTELPGTDWLPDPWTQAAAIAAAPMPAPWHQAGRFRHVFTHFELYLDVFSARVPHIDAHGFLRPIDALDTEALPSLMRKGVKLGKEGLLF